MQARDQVDYRGKQKSLRASALSHCYRSFL